MHNITSSQKNHPSLLSNFPMLNKVHKIDNSTLSMIFITVKVHQLDEFITLFELIALMKLEVIFYVHYFDGINLLDENYHSNESNSSY